MTNISRFVLDLQKQTSAINNDKINDELKSLINTIQKFLSVNETINQLTDRINMMGDKMLSM